VEHRYLIRAALSVAIVVSACSPGPTGSPSPSFVGGGSPTVLPVLVSSEVVVGPNRLVFSFLDAKTNRPAASPERSASFAFVPATSSSGNPAATSVGEFFWGIEGVNGLYVTNVTLPTAGDWTAEVTTSAPGGPTETIRFDFQVKDDASAIRVGEKAPASDTPTAEDVGGDLAQLSTDDDPDPAFYESSVADAVRAGQPFVLVFATPAFCTSKQCGPTLDSVKPLAAEFPAVTFIHVEPFELAFVDGRLQPVLDGNGQLKAVAAVNEWGLLSEPWTFVVEGSGVVRASFEGAAAADELRGSIEAVAG
jgi:hypothetical protein